MKDILDVKGLIMHSFFRCKDSGSHLRDRDGKQVATANAAFTTFLDSYMFPIMEFTPPIDIIAVWEGGNIRRKELYPKYKGNRPKPEEKDPVVEEQLDQLYLTVKDFLLGIGASNVTVPSVEADDAIAYLSKGLKEPHTVHTRDDDLVQLQSNLCQVVAREIFVGSDDWENPTPPELIAMHKAIVGDTSDNYGGVKGMGPAAWTSLLELYGEDGMLELEELVLSRNRKELKQIVEDTECKYLEKLETNFNQLCLMHQLASLHPEWCESTHKRKLIKPEWHRRVPSAERVQNCLDKTGNLDRYLELAKFMPDTRLITKQNVDATLYEGDFLDDLNVRPVAFDYETDDPNKYECYRKNNPDFVDVLSSKITGASFTWGDNYQKTIYITVDHLDAENNCDLSVIGDMLEAVDQLVVQNSSFEETVTYRNLGKEFKEKLFGKMIDTKIMSNYVDENKFTGLKQQSKDRLNYDQASYKETVGEASGMSQITSDEVFSYGADDAIVTAHLYHMYDTILQVENTTEFMHENEFIFNSVFTESFQKGCVIDLEQLEKLRDKDEIELEKSYARLRNLLEENCTEEDLDATEKYMQEITPFEVAKMRDNEKDDEYISNKLQEKRAKFLKGTAYVPYKSEHIPYAFLPTIAQFKKIFIKLAPELNDLDAEAEDYLDNFLNTVAPTKISEEYAVKRDNFPDAVKYLMSLVMAAAHQFKAREGDEYEKLATYVRTVMKDEGKIVTSGDELNFDSPDQTAQMLYGKLALPIRHYSNVQEDSTRKRLGFGGGPSTNAKAIEIAMAEDAPEGSLEREVLELIMLIKTLQTHFKYYYNPYPNWVSPDDGRIHPQIINCSTTTRRPTGSSPNVLQVKKGLIRSIYLPLEDDHVLVAPDFSGQELRILGSESGDEVLIDAYMGEEKKDVHSLTASAIMPVIANTKRPDIAKHIIYKEGSKAQSYDQFEEWQEDDRYAEFANFVRNKRAKAVNFLVNYEGQANTLSTNLLVSKEEAQDFLDSMFALYPKIPVFQQNTHKIAKAQGYVTTAYGNRRHMTDDIVSKDDGKRMRMERQGSNFRIQGCAADILKKVVTEAYKSGLLESTESTIIAPVYDELVCSVPVKHVVDFCQRLQQIMDLLPPSHVIPMVSEFSIGFDWYNMVEFGTDTSEETVLKSMAKAKEIRAEFKEEA